MDQPLFRHEVIEARRNRLAGTVVAAMPPGSRVYVAVAGGATAILLLLLLFGSYASRVSVPGVLAFDRGIARVYPPAPAIVRAVHVHPGQLVRAGDPLVTLSLSPGRDSGGEGMAGQLAQLARQDQDLVDQQRLLDATAAADARAFIAQRAGLTASVTSIRRQIAIASDQIAVAASEKDRSVRLANQGAGSRKQVEESRAAWLTRRADLEALNERLIAQQEQLQTLDAQATQKRIDSARARSELAAKRSALAQDRAGLVRQDHLTLTAPVSGTVADLTAAPGEHARPDASAVTIVPAGSRLQAWLYAPSRAAGFVHPGQSVHLLLDAFPYDRYGAVPGRVVAVAAVASDPGSVDPGLGIKEPVFRIRVALDSGRLRLGSGRLREGMTLSAQVLLERRRLWQMLLGPMSAGAAR